MIPAAHIYFRWGTQARRLYDLLACGPATPSKIVRELHIYNYHQVIDEIRRTLDGTGVTVKSSPVNGRRTVWEYRLARMDAPDCERNSGCPRCETIYGPAASAGGGCRI
jgi:hypothetical protein